MGNKMSTRVTRETSMIAGLFCIVVTFVTHVTHKILKLINNVEIGHEFLSHMKVAGHIGNKGNKIQNVPVVIEVLRVTMRRVSQIASQMTSNARKIHVGTFLIFNQSITH